MNANEWVNLELDKQALARLFFERDMNLCESITDDLDGYESFSIRTINPAESTLIEHSRKHLFRGDL